MLNRRKAMIGWLVYTAGKPLAKRAVKSRAKTAKGAVPGGSSSSGGAKRGAALIAAAGAVVGGLAFWRSRKSDDGSGESEGSAGEGSEPSGS